MKRVLTIHTNNAERHELRLTPHLVEVLRVIAEEFDSPRLRQRSDGIAVYVNDWRGRA